MQGIEKISLIEEKSVSEETEKGIPDEVCSGIK